MVVMLAIAALGAWWMYRKPKSKTLIDQILFWIKRFSRFVSLFLILLLLLSPVIKFFSNEVEKPILLFFLDDSQSIKAEDSIGAFQFHKDWEEFSNKLSNSFEVHNYYFDNSVSDSFNNFLGKKTHLNTTLNYANTVYKRKNVGALIVATDGIINAGNNPIYEPMVSDYPVFTIGLGDTTEKKDILVKEINHNSLVFLNNSFNVLAHIQSLGYKGKTVKVSLLQNGKEVSTQNLIFTSENDYKILEFIVDANKTGFHRYSIKVSALEGERTLTNNQRDFYVEVIDGREKILILYQSPHPDVNALASALSENKNLEVITKYADEVNESDFSNISLVIGHQFPSLTTKQIRLIKNIRSRKIAFWAIVGAQSPIEQLTSVLPEVRIIRRGDSWTDAQVSINSQFNAFSFSENLIEQSAEWSPLISPFGRYVPNTKFEVLAFQSINNIAMEYPLIAFSENEGVKTGWTFGEGLWRWRMSDYARNNKPELFNELINKIARYLIIKEDKRRFRVYPVKNEFDEDESIRFQGELFDRNFEPISDAEIVVNLINDQGKEFSYRMSATGSNAGYDLDIGNFESGYYNFKAEVTGRPEFEKIKGGLLIKPIQIELSQLQANFGLLKEWAAVSDGKFFYKNQFDQLEEAIRNDTRIKPLIKTKTRIEELVKIEYVLLLIAFFLSLEWFIRKWEGGY